MSIEAIILLAATTPAWLWGALITALAVGMFILTGDAKSREQSPTIRVPVPTDAAPIWIGLGVMMIFFVGTPAVFGSMFAGSPPAASQPSTRSVNLEQAILANMATYVCSILAGVLIHLYMRSPAPRFLGLAKPTWPQVRLLVSASLVAISLTYLVSGVTRLLLEWSGWQHPANHQMLDWMAQLSDRPGLRAMAIISATILAPMFEELFFRGHLQTALVGLLPNRWAGIAITSFLFASIHDWWTIPPIFVLSMCLGAIYERTNNLWMPVAMHVAFNATSTAVFLSVR